MRYKKKSIEIDAIQFNRNNFKELVEFTGGLANSLTIERRINGKCWCFLDVLSERLVMEGDFVTVEKTADGIKFGVYKKEAFNKKFNLINE